GGLGRHALYYARKGWSTTAIDISKIACEKLRAAAESERFSITIYTGDLDTFRFGAWNGQFDVVLVFFYLLRQLFPALPELLRPGGLLVYKTHLRSPTNSESAPSNPDHVLEPGELPRAFAEMEILHYAEQPIQRSTAELVARKR